MQNGTIPVAALLSLYTIRSYRRQKVEFEPYQTLGRMLRVWIIVRACSPKIQLIIDMQF